MKVHVIKESDFQRLLNTINRDPGPGLKGGSSQTLSKEETEAYKEAHGFYNYQVRTWVALMKEEG